MNTIGLTDSEVLQSREAHGENRITTQKRKSLLKSFLESFGDPMIKILLLALAINVIFLFKSSNWFESLGIAIAVFLATLVSTLSEYGSESAFARLQEEASRLRCRVKRTKNGISQISEIPVADIVVGDIVLLQSGDRIPADGVIISGRLEVDQSSLNGESKEAEKVPSHASADTGFQNPGLLFSGSIVCAGEGYMRVTDVGDGTIYGRIGAEIQEETRESPLKVRLAGLAASIGKIGYLAATVNVLAYFFNVLVLDNHFNSALIMGTIMSPGIMLEHVMKAATLAVTIIVMAVPEGLPMMITVVLSANMKRMLKDNVLVRKLTGIETAGSMNILFTDKTGTLTKGRLDVTRFITGTGREWEKNDAKSIPPKLKSILHDSIYYNSAASMSAGAAIGGNATDRASLEFVSALDIDSRSIRRGAQVPFSSALKFMATTVSGALNATLIKGAPEVILPHCCFCYDDTGAQVSLASHRINDIVKKLAEKAIRVVAIAVSDRPVSRAEDFRRLTLVGLLGIRDEIRPEAIEGVRMMRRAGIQTVMITGDSPVTALAIAREAGIVTGDTDLIITSEQLNAMSDEVLASNLHRLRVVARALPSDKSRLVRAAQALNLVVGMTGDGVNDAPALKQADIGFSMGSGTEVAKEAGDIVILDDNFNSISKAVCYGRTIFKSIRKFIIYQLSICMCAVGVTVVGPLIGVDFPITVIQMLWINIVMDTLAGLAFSGETARRKYMQEPPKPRDEPILNSYMRGQVAVNSLYTCMLCLFFLKSPVIGDIFSRYGTLYYMTAFFALFMFCAIFTSFCARTHEVNLLDYLAANKPFLWIMGMVTVIQLIILYFGGSLFRTVGLAFEHILLVAGLAVTVIPVDLIRKAVLNRTSGCEGT